MDFNCHVASWHGTVQGTSHNFSNYDHVVLCASFDFFLWNIIMKLFSILMHFKTISSCDAKLNFQQPLLQSSVSHDPSEIILICWFGSQEEKLLLIISVFNHYAAVFVETIFLNSLNE